MTLSYSCRFVFAGLLLATFGIGSLAGCADPQEPDPGWSIGDDVASGRIDVRRPDADETGKGDSGQSSGAADCGPQVVSTGFVEGADRPIVMNGSVYFEKRTKDGQQVFVQNPQNEQSHQLTRETDPVSLLAADRGRLLTWNFDPRFSRFHIRDRAGRTLTTIAASDFGVRSYPLAVVTGEPSKFFDGELFVGSAGGDLQVFDSDGQPIAPTIHTSAHHMRVSTVALTAAGFAYAGAPVSFGDYDELEPGEIFLWEPGVGRVQITATDENERYIWADGQFVYWASELGVYRYHLEAQSPPVRVYRGHCAPPHAINQRVVFACAEDEGDEVTLGERAAIPQASQLLLINGNETRRLELEGHRELIHSVRLSESGIVWVEFDEADAVCNGEGTGRVMYYDLDTEQQLEVGAIHTPCWCCDSPPPRINVSIEGGIVAWNKAVAPSHAGQSGVGYAMVGTELHCRTRERLEDE